MTADAIAHSGELTASPYEPAVETAGFPRLHGVDFCPPCCNAEANDYRRNDYRQPNQQSSEHGLP
jgi:hypothetical protein